MFFEAVYFGHFLSFHTMQLEPPKAYVKDSHLPEQTYCALDRTAELLAKLRSGSKDRECDSPV